MHRIQHGLDALLKVGFCAVLALGFLAQAQEKKASPVGTWTWTTPGRNGGPDRKSTLTLKMDGEKLAGKISAPGRGGNAQEIEIQEAKMKGDELTFNVVRERNGNKITTKYTGKVRAESIKGKVTFERNGEEQSREWEAKREADKK